MYANRAFVKARKLDWDGALYDAIKSVSIQPSLNGYISKGIALCGKQQVRGARTAFDVASVFVHENSKRTHHLLLIKAIALFNAGEHQEALLLIEELATACPDIDPLVCRIIEAHLHVQLGTIAMEKTHYTEAVDHFTTAVNASAAFSNSFDVRGIGRALRVGSQVLVADHNTETVPCAASVWQTWRRPRIVPIHNGNE